MNRPDPVAIEHLHDLVNGVERVMLDLPMRGTALCDLLLYYGVDEECLTDLVALLTRVGVAAKRGMKHAKA